MKRVILLLTFVFGAWLPEAKAGPILASHIQATVTEPNWSYAVFNDEPSGSPNFITAFTLSVNAAITVTGTPGGWDSTTDGLTFVQWFNTDLALPYPNDIAPGTSLNGFFD